ncbi:hypothetical protein SALBM311S_08528 [Streptomyces alboniger]
MLRQQILDRVWDPHYEGPTKTLDVHVAALRRKLGHPGWIQTLRGVGFRLAVHTGPNEAAHLGPGEGAHSGPVGGLHTGPAEGLHTGPAEGLRTRSFDGLHTRPAESPPTPGRPGRAHSAGRGHARQLGRQLGRTALTHRLAGQLPRLRVAGASLSMPLGRSGSSARGEGAGGAAKDEATSVSAYAACPRHRAGRAGPARPGWCTAPPGSAGRWWSSTVRAPLWPPRIRSPPRPRARWPQVLHEGLQVTLHRAGADVEPRGERRDRRRPRRRRAQVLHQRVQPGSCGACR